MPLADAAWTVPTAPAATAPAPASAASRVRPIPGRFRRRPCPRQAAWLGWLAAVLACGLVFRTWPGLDLAASAPFYLPQIPTGFVGNLYHGVLDLWRLVPQLGRALAIAGLVLLLVPARRIPCGMARRWRGRLLAVAALLMLGVCLVVNQGLKAHVGRPRPQQVKPFGGPYDYVPVGSLSQACARNCSFVSGHAATGFVIAGFGLWGVRRTRRRWWMAGALLCLALGAARVAQGGHFASDVVFSLLVMTGVAMALRAAVVHLRGLRRRIGRRHRARLRGLWGLASGCGLPRRPMIPLS